MHIAVYIGLEKLIFNECWYVSFDALSINLYSKNAFPSRINERFILFSSGLCIHVAYYTGKRWRVSTILALPLPISWNHNFSTHKQWQTLHKMLILYKNLMQKRVIICTFGCIKKNVCMRTGIVLGFVKVLTYSIIFISLSFDWVVLDFHPTLALI